MKYLFSIFVLSGIFLISCGNQGHEAETKEAQKVSSNKTSESIAYTTLKPGSFIDWRASHLGGINKRFGKVQIKGAKALVNGDKLANAKAEIDLNTLTVESFPEGSSQKEKLTGHLKSEDFFDVAKYPLAAFELTGVAAGEGEYNAKVTGNLSIKGVTKSISFPANIHITPSEISLESAPFTVDRSDWGLSYHAKGTPGVPVDYLISDDVGFTLHLKLGR